MPGTTVFCRSRRTRNEMDNGRLCHSTPAFLQSMRPCSQKGKCSSSQAQEAAQPALLLPTSAVWLTESLQVWCGIRTQRRRTTSSIRLLSLLRMAGHSTSSAVVTHFWQTVACFQPGAPGITTHSLVATTHAALTV